MTQEGHFCDPESNPDNAKSPYELLRGCTDLDLGLRNYKQCNIHGWLLVVR
jgi:hypothetical protein